MTTANKSHLIRQHFSESPSPGNKKFSLSLPSVLFATLLTMTFVFATSAQAGTITIEPITAYNAVVDSNVLSPSTYAPRSATIGAKFCNYSGTDMTNVTVYIGDAPNNNPGLYPKRYTESTDFLNNHNHLYQADTDFTADNEGYYSLTHESGSVAVATDATRYIGALADGECKVQYWLFSYPQTSDDEKNPTTVLDPEVSVTGGSIKPDDDLWLNYDYWATESNALLDVAGEAVQYKRKTLTMRNEISASANKIWPNGDNKVPDEYKDAIVELHGWDTITPRDGDPTAYPGETVTSEGIWYDLGNVGAGFDNNGDTVPDYNAWLQPIGDPSTYDPGCFRLIGTHGIVIVKLKGGGELLVPFIDQLYYENIPLNTGAVGLVFYEYVSLDGACTAGLTPYQEVASGFDNEKFSADFGAGFPPLQSREPEMILDKTVSFNDGITFADSLSGVPLPATLTYKIYFENTFEHTVILGAIDFNHDGVITTDGLDDGDYNGIKLYNGLVDLNGDGIISALDDSATLGLFDGRIVTAGAIDMLTPFNTTVTRTMTIIAGAIDLNDDGATNTDDGIFYGTKIIGGRLDLNGSGGVDGSDDGTFLGKPVIDGLVDFNGDGQFTSADAGVLGGAVIGNMDINMPLVVRDTIPTGTDYKLGSATSSMPAGTNAIFRHSTDGGLTWIIGEPADQTAADDVTDIEWWLDQSLDYVTPDNNGFVTFQTIVPGTFVGPIVDNTAGLAVGTGPTFDEDTATVFFTGNNSIGDRVFTDDGGTSGIFGDGILNVGGGETGIDGVDIYLYYDKSGDGIFDIDDILLYNGVPTTTATSGADAGVYNFLDLPDGKYFVVLDKNTAPAGFGSTTLNPFEETADRIVLAVDLDWLSASDIAVIGDSDFAFIEPLVVTKELVGGATTIYQDEQLTYKITLENKMPGAGVPAGTGQCTYMLWGTNYKSYTKDFEFMTEATGIDGPNDTYASEDYGQVFIASLIDYKMPSNVPLGATISNVDAIVQMYASIELTSSVGEYAEIDVFLDTVTLMDSTSPITIGQADLGRFVTQANAGQLVVPLENDITRAWTVDDFNIALHTLELHYSNHKTGGSDPASRMNIDAMGFRVTVNEPCAAEDSSILSPVPLTDTYNGTYLNFVSADPSVDDSSVLNTLDWNDVGPIYPGEKKEVLVTFDADDPGAASQSITNLATVDSAKFADGRAANDDSGSVVVTLLPTSYVSGFVWNDAPGANNGWVGVAPTTGTGYEADDEFIDMAKVNLYVCLTTDNISTGVPITPSTATSTASNCTGNTNDGFWVLSGTTHTDPTGAYQFKAIRDGYYYVEVDTTTISGTTTQTGDLNEVGVVCSSCDSQSNDVGDDLADIAITVNNGDGVDDYPNFNFGYTGLQPAVHGNVWHDMNGDADTLPHPDDGDNGYAGLTVTIFDADCSSTTNTSGIAINPATTDADGNYTFLGLTNLTSYCIVLTGAVGTQTYETVDDTPGTNVTPTTSFDQQIIFTTADDVNEGSYDFAFQPTGSSRIGDTVFYDFNGDGIQDGTADVPMVGIAVDLYEDSDGNHKIDIGVDALIGTAITDSNGEYLFTGLADGNYIVTVDKSDPAHPFPSNVIQTKDPDETGTCGTCDGSGYPVVEAATATDYLDQDFGYQPAPSTGSIGSFVWNDKNGNGVIDSDNGEENLGIAGVTVTLQWDPTGGTDYVTVLTTTTSDGTTDVDGDGIIDPVGSYYFGNLPDSAYKVIVSSIDPNLPKDGANTPYQKTTGTFDTAPNPLTDIYFERTISGGNSYTDVNFGFVSPASLGDLIYWDANLNGDYDLNEPGIGDVRVELRNGSATETLTVDGTDYNPGALITFELTSDGSTDVTGDGISDPLGMYMFEGLPPYDYYEVSVISGSGTEINGQPQTADPDRDGVACAVDDPNLTTCDNKTTNLIALDYGNIYTAADFGYQPAAVIGNQLFIDRDASGGDMDANDAPLPYVLVTLNDCGADSICDASDTVYTTYTDENGVYSFINLPDNHTFKITVDPADFPANLTLNSSYNGPTGTDDDGTLDHSITRFTSTNNFDDADFGYQYTPVSSLSGTVCLEPSTDTNHYCGDTANQTDGVTTDENAYEGTPVYVYKWTDSTNSGVFDSGELVLLNQTVTNADGNYSFTGLPTVDLATESYVISLTAPEDFIGLTTTATDTPAVIVTKTPSSGDTVSAWQFVPDDGDNAGLDFAFTRTVEYDFGDLALPFETTLDIDGARHIVPNPLAPTLFLGTGEVGVDTEFDGQPSTGATADTLDDGITTIDKANWTETASGGSIAVATYGSGWFMGWIDFNGDGSLGGPDEMIVSQALGADGAFINTQLSFDIPTGGLSSPGNARFRFFPSQPPVPTLAFKGLAEDGEVEDYWFNLSNVSSIGNTIWLDADGDGVQDPGEGGIANVVVELQNKYCNPGVDCPTTVTDADGKYIFSGIGIGDYTVAVKTVPEGLTVTYDEDAGVAPPVGGGAPDGKTLVTIGVAGTTYDTANFGYRYPAGTATIGDRVWNDANGNGIQDSGEAGIEGLTVTLTGTSDATTTTDAAGNYIFYNLAPGDYSVEVTPPITAGVVQTGDPDLPLDCRLFSACDNKTTTAVTLAANEVHLDADVGYLFPATSTSDIGDLIWHDTDGALENVTVVLKNDSGEIIAQDVTDASGNYLFPGLLAGTYTVEITDTNNVLGQFVQTADPDLAFDGSHELTIDPLVEDFYETVDFNYDDPAATYATISSFAAYVDANQQTVLQWSTGSEIGTIGFMLERLNEKSGRFQAVSKNLLPGQLMPPQGGTYRLVDKHAVIGRTYTYRIQEIAVTNSGAFYGPYTVRAEQPLPVKTDMVAEGSEGYSVSRSTFSKKELKRFAAKDTAVSRLAAIQAVRTGNTLKIPVHEDGLVYLSALRLSESSGIALVEVQQYIKKYETSLTFNGEAVSYLAANNGVGLWFYGTASEDQSAAYNVYRLVFGEPGAGITTGADKPKTEAPADQVVAYTVSGEENLIPIHYYTTEALDDLWVWKIILPPYASYSSVTQYLDAPAVTPDMLITLKANFMAVSNGGDGTVPPYAVDITINGQPVGSADWNTRGSHEVVLSIQAGLLQETNNEIIVTGRLNSGVGWFLAYLDSIELEYPRSYQADNGTLSFVAGDHDSVTVDGFTTKSVLALDITDNRQPVRLRTLPSRIAPGAYAITINTVPGNRYILTENLEATSTAPVYVDTPSLLTDTGNIAEYLVITADHLKTTAQRLLDHRTDQGLTGMMVDIEDVYDEFSHGIPMPQAIGAFLHYAYENWSGIPKYVVLIGEGSFDYKDYLGYGYPVVPSTLTITPDGHFSTDNLYGDINDDGVPEISVGRLPVLTESELNSVIDKIIVYELDNTQFSATIIADKLDPAAGDFAASGALVKDLLPSQYIVNQLDVDTLGITQVKDGIFAALRQGAGLFHYVGHSNVSSLGITTLFSASDITGMTDIGQPMLMAIMACSSVNYGYPPQRSFGEEALLKVGGAGVTVWGASGLSRNPPADVLAEGYYTALFDSANTRIGDIVIQAKQHYKDQGSAERYILDIFNLMGDPATLTPEAR